MNREVTARALTGIKLVEPGDDLGAIAVAAFAANGLMPEAGDVLVVAQKIVSKAEGRYVDRRDRRALGSGRSRSPPRLDKDPRFVEVVLGESKRVVRHRPGLLIVEHRLGFVMANAGIDHSNIPRRRDRARAAAAERPGRLGARACATTSPAHSACGSRS